VLEDGMTAGEWLDASGASETTFSTTATSSWQRGSSRRSTTVTPTWELKNRKSGSSPVPQNEWELRFAGKTWLLLLLEK